MPRSALAILILCAVAAPAAAQLTPEQRVERETQANWLNSARWEEERREARSLAGDPTAYGGPAAGYRRVGGDSWRSLNERMTIGGPVPGTWTGLGSGPTRTGALRRTTEAPRKWKADKPCLLTIASPIGAPGRSLMIRTRILGVDAQPVWARMGEVTADSVGRYFVAMPTVPAGRYTLAIEVYDPNVPERPYSESRTPLVVD